MKEKKIDLVGLHENAYLDKFISAWAHSHLELTSRMSVMREVSSILEGRFGYESRDVLDCIIRKIDEKLPSFCGQKIITPIASLYAYAQSDTNTSEYFGISLRSIRYTKAAIRNYVKSILKSKCIH